MIKFNFNVSGKSKLFRNDWSTWLEGNHSMLAIESIDYVVNSWGVILNYSFSRFSENTVLSGDFKF